MDGREMLTESKGYWNYTQAERLPWVFGYRRRCLFVLPWTWSLPGLMSTSYDTINGYV
jgi:hypothetical protein